MQQRLEEEGVAQSTGSQSTTWSSLGGALRLWGLRDKTVDESSDLNTLIGEQKPSTGNWIEESSRELYFQPYLQTLRGDRLEQASAQALIIYLYNLPDIADRIGLEDELLQPFHNNLELLRNQPVMPETVARAQTLVSEFEREIIWSMRRAGNALWHQLLQLRLSIPGLLSLRSNLDLIDAISEPKQAIMAYEQVITRMQDVAEHAPRAPRNRFYLCCATFLLDRALLLEYISYPELRSCYGQIVSLQLIPEHLRTQALIRIIDQLSEQLKEAAYPINAVEADYLREEIRQLWEDMPNRESILTPGQELAIRNSASRAFRLSNPYARARAGRRALRHLELSAGLA